MSAPSIEKVTARDRHLPSAISRRIIFRLAPKEGALPFTTERALGFGHALHGTTKEQADFRVTALDGRYFVDFRDSGPVRACERVAGVLFSNFGMDFTNAELEEARIERSTDATLGVPITKAWEQMDNVTRLVSRIMDWKQNQLLADAPNQLRDELYKT